MSAPIYIAGSTVYRCATCGTPFDFEERLPDPAQDRCTTCGGSTFHAPGVDRAGNVLEPVVRAQLASDALLFVRFEATPYGVLTPWPDGPCYVGVVLGAQLDWASYIGPAAWVDEEEDEDVAMGRIRQEGVKLDATIACALFPFMNPNGYRS